MKMPFPHYFENSRHVFEVNVFQVVRMLISIVITFVICWGPLLIFNVLQSFEIVGNFLIGMEKHLKSIFSLLAYFNR